MAERLVDHLVGDLVTIYTVPPDDELRELMGWSDRSWVGHQSQEETSVFDGRVQIDGEEHFAFGGLGPKSTVPAWQICGFHADGVQLTCTAWQAGIDPRSTLDGMTHVDPTGDQPIGICPIHDL